MRLINTHTLEFVEFFGDATPPYAILSHTWGDGEVSLKEMMEQPLTLRSKRGYQKVVDYCRLAAQQGHAWVWVDTCCIDKTNHAELAESINSMFRWYKGAAVCHVFLQDLAADANLATALPRCRWFTRGWTLQELLAPANVEFYDESWEMRGTKNDLIAELTAITGILGAALRGAMPLQRLNVGVRMSWAADRETTRPEDLAYCLLGIFDVNMPMIYGEGNKAFLRLQEEIIRQGNDLTIFAFQHNLGSLFKRTNGLVVTRPLCPLLALFPHQFMMHSAKTTSGLLRRPRIGTKCSELNPEYNITNRGLRITTALVRLPSPGKDAFCGLRYFFPVGEVQYPSGDNRERDTVGLILDKVAPNVFLRGHGPLHVLPGTELLFPTLTPSLEFYIGMGGVDLPSRRWDFGHESIKVHNGRFPIEFREDTVRTGPSHAAVYVRKGIPESHWDQTKFRFFCSPSDPIYFAFSLILKLDDGHVVPLICLLDQKGIANGPGPLAYIINPAKQTALGGWFSSTRAARGGTYWEDLRDLWDGRMSHSLEITMNGTPYVVTADFTVTDGGRDKYNLRFALTHLGPAAAIQQPAQT